MRKAAVAAAVFLAFPLVISGCRKAQTEQTIAAPVADGMETESVSEEQIEEEKIASVIDTAIPIMPGARIAVVSKATKGEFWDLVFEGMEQAVEDVNEAYEFSGDQKVTITVEGPDEEQMVEEQINTLDAVIAENPAAVCISVGDMNSSQAQLESARENGIPVVVFDSNVYETDLITAFRATDNGQVGRMAGYHLAEAIGKSGNVAVFSAQKKTESAHARVEGFLEQMAEYDGIDVISVIYEDQVEDMETAMQEFLENCSNLDGVFCTNADVSDLYLDMEKDEENRVIMVGTDATSRQQKAVENGEEIGIVSQDPVTIGYQTVWTALQAALPEEAGVDVEKEVLFNPVWIDQNNLNDPAFASYIYK